MANGLRVEIEVVSLTVAEKLARRFAESTLRALLGPVLLTTDTSGDRLVYTIDLADGQHVRREVPLLGAPLGVGWERELLWVEGPTSVITAAALALGARQAQAGERSARAGWHLPLGDELRLDIPRLGQLVVRRAA